ncbi:aldehyde dehydrogenase [Thermaurantimonas aggregans]|uniref:aldehyde dehydrogenase (NAD(+)) n=1 Tax=Thermaurantimonas aggregans TaxID=2173829 RepID=A0A401XMR5_9FLAO|nr:aldehyde dehydrogenase family protein [Thermaurantimonas aggregans]MCX8149404.1 aldehyde dehydrogenase family protein [Thermaurantimonas aggregans]GCD78301.1 aldehyde dehydrogenase [Thermaurantimonas aggregans]
METLIANDSKVIPGTWVGKDSFLSTNLIESYSPIDNSLLGAVSTTTREQYDTVITEAYKAFKEWRKIPAPKRGAFVRAFADRVREKKEELAKLITLEMGKSIQEALGEVQEIIDICDFAVGLSRQLYGLTIQSERPNHKMLETWHPLGIVGIISAFNFPMAVWSWNSTIAWVCGNVTVWKPSEKVPLCAIELQKIVSQVLDEFNYPQAISSVINGDYRVGEFLSHDHRVALVSATGSTRMGKEVAKAVSERLGRYLLELGGNNAIIVTPSADLKLLIPAVVFGAVGTAGQRCTSTRRLIIHNNVYEKVLHAIKNAYNQLKIGNPLDEKNHLGPLIDKTAVDNYLKAIEKAVSNGGRIIHHGGVLEGEEYASGLYVKPCIIEVTPENPMVQVETFAPILYVMRYERIEEAIEIHNNVPQGLSSSIMTLNMREAEYFLSSEGSDCGIANVNIGTSGAEIGGAFGGEKETGGGRESGSDAWKNYMRRQTTTINYGTDLPLAQGIKFTIE